MLGKKRLNEQEEYEFDQVYEKDYEGEFAEIPAEDPESPEDLIPIPVN